MNLSFLEYYCSNLSNRTFERILLNGPNNYLPNSAINSLLIMLVLEIMDKERIMIEKAVQEGEVIGETMVVKKLDIGG